MYHARKTGSCQPKTVVSASVRVPMPKRTTPISHHKTWRALRFRRQWRWSTTENPTATSVVTMGRNDTRFAAATSMTCEGR